MTLGEVNCLFYICIPPFRFTSMSYLKIVSKLQLPKWLEYIVAFHSFTFTKAGVIILFRQLKLVWSKVYRFVFFSQSVCIAPNWKYDLLSA